MAPNTREVSMPEATERHFGTDDLHQNFMVENQKRLNATCKLASRDGKFRPKEVISYGGHAPGGKFLSKPEKGQSNRCTVDGKPYYNHFKSNRWFPADYRKSVHYTDLVDDCLYFSNL
jgi:hypothetical protein